MLRLCPARWGVKSTKIVLPLVCIQHAIPMSTPRRGSKHIARGRAKRHPGNTTGVGNRSERAKALNVNYLHSTFLCFCPFRARAFALRTPGVPLRSAPGYVLAAPAGRTRIYRALYLLPSRRKSCAPASETLCSCIGNFMLFRIGNLFSGVLKPTVNICKLKGWKTNLV